MSAFLFLMIAVCYLFFIFFQSVLSAKLLSQLTILLFCYLEPFLIFYFINFTYKQMTEVLQRKFLKPASISDSLKCIVCSDVYVNPVRLYCSHTFCKICIDGVLKASGNCPMCRQKIDKKNWGPDRIAQNIIDELQVFCPVDDCPWKGMNLHLDTHYNEECVMKNQVKNSGKSHKKTKIFNMEMIKDDQVQQKINKNLIKGSLGARLQVARKKNQPTQGRQTNESLFCQSQKDVQKQKPIDKKGGVCDFLEELFE